jgi:hypothetical protein
MQDRTIRYEIIQYNTIQYNKTHHTKSHTLKATFYTQNYKKKKKQNKNYTLSRFRNELKPKYMKYQGNASGYLCNILLTRITEFYVHIYTHIYIYYTDFYL